MRFLDCDGNELCVGDEVTVNASPGSHAADDHRSHGSIVKLGRKLVHVRLADGGHRRAGDGVVRTVPPEDLRKGLHGHPRPQRAVLGQLQKLAGDSQRDYLDRVLGHAVHAGTISPAQHEAIMLLAYSLDEAGRR
ncbi:hypothetical protein MOQ72_39165 [Saccharopolyspora sp. K220]|uniref:hypothetical protein n=1 Tax=Saccharopolyspora soli TaxID=2926618 RepID=UPI001F571949|nr:hypothetical protein [Saccharopolyspora soli]MCI2423449.1 hypothetical protein [Saccharopolyspora soli]